MRAIYQIQNTVTKDAYIGSSVDFAYRKWCHLRDLHAGNHKNPILQNSWNKHSEKAFTFSVLEIPDSDNKLIEREQYYIDTLNPRYNICRTAGSPLGVKHTAKAKLHMSIAHKGKTLKESGHRENCKCCICDRKDGIESPRYIPREDRFCACGCQKTFTCPINSKKKFISGHNGSQRGRKRTQEHITKWRESMRKYYDSKSSLRTRVRG